MEGCLLPLGPSEFRRQQQPPQTRSSRSQRQLIRARLHKVTGGLERDARQPFAGRAFGCINFRPFNSELQVKKKTKTTYHVTLASPPARAKADIPSAEGFVSSLWSVQDSSLLVAFCLFVFFSVFSRSFPACVGYNCGW